MFRLRFAALNMTKRFCDCWWVIVYSDISRSQVSEARPGHPDSGSNMGRLELINRCVWNRGVGGMRRIERIPSAYEATWWPTSCRSLATKP
jgi:hypothetical protein